MYMWVSFLIFIGLFFLLVSFRELLIYYIVCNCVAEGTVIRHEETNRFVRKQKLYRTLVRFQIGNEIYAVPSNILHTKDILLKEGSTVLIRFNPKKPTESAFVDYGARIYISWLLFFISGIWTISVVYLLLKII